MQLFAIFAGAFAFLFPRQAQGLMTVATNAIKQTSTQIKNTGGEVFGPFLPANVWTATKVKQVAAKYVFEYGLNCNPVMIAAMVKIESRYNPKAYRFEKHLNDASYGLMQTMTKTAQWLYDDMKYRAFPRPTGSDLYDGYVSLYFGMAYVDYLSKYGKKQRDERWIVESYNGGPGNSNPGTQNHLRKYYEAKTEVA
ncbi:MAG: hypothetical protein DI626_05780 [Micavibrio aeruginosavorus]|uniref:Transglycosylase SLT domain-containing protein n=1 Tax=Micavibrio aeruginosavorus TaxID=349221 RepID=A0A2W4ZZ86_9BACT|nr:MAG: hypothetical protein DI626_05780 [Micavibrio aeruginosavorus]